MTQDRVGIWGPPQQERNPYAATPTDQAPLQPAPVAPAPLPQPVRERSIRWGLLDVLWGFLLMFASQIFLSVALVVVVATQLLSANESVEDPSALLESTLTQALSAPFILVSALAMYLSWWFAARRASKKKGLGSYAKDFWIKFNWKRDIPIGLGIAAVLRLFEQGVLWFLANVVGMDLSEVGNADVVISQEGFWFFINAIVVAAFLAPFFEEFFFRGLFLQASLRLFGQSRTRNNGEHTWFSRNRVWLSILITSVAFGLMHFQGDPSSVGHWIVVAQTGIIGAVLAWVTVKTKSVGIAIATHVAFNLSGVLLATFLGGS